jgi:hypothetical protein
MPSSGTSSGEGLNAMNKDSNSENSIEIRTAPFVVEERSKLSLQRSIRARVVWTGPEEEGSGTHKLGVEFETPEFGFWGDDYSLKPFHDGRATTPHLHSR